MCSIQVISTNISVRRQARNNPLRLIRIFA